jgi:hypothetical protein
MRVLGFPSHKQIVMQNEKIANSDEIANGEEPRLNHHDHTEVARIDLFPRKVNSTSVERAPINSWNIFGVYKVAIQASSSIH